MDKYVMRKKVNDQALIEVKKSNFCKNNYAEFATFYLEYIVIFCCCEFAIYVKNRERETSSKYFQYFLFIWPTRSPFALLAGMKIENVLL